MTGLLAQIIQVLGQPSSRWSPLSNHASLHSSIPVLCILQPPSVSALRKQSCGRELNIFKMAFLFVS